MTSLTGAASEVRATGDSYRKMGIADSKFVFYIPVYKNMPLQTVNLCFIFRFIKICHLNPVQ